MADLDSKKDMRIAKMWLEDEKIGYVMVQSGPTTFWAFIDNTTESNRDAINTACLIPGTDEDYKTWLVQKKMMVVRGFYKEDYEPRIMHRKSDVTIVNLFCDQLIEHYQSEKVRWMYKHKVYNSGDLSKIRTEITPAPAPDPEATRKLDL